jgi:hypothetical protein
MSLKFQLITQTPDFKPSKDGAGKLAVGPAKPRQNGPLSLRPLMAGDARRRSDMPFEPNAQSPLP